jgi:lactate dehydrogenase-like 2-hydroxyacid dehydrogenase
MYVVLSQKELENAPEGEVVIVEYDVKVLESFLIKKRPKALITASTGYDNLPIDKAKELGIPCYNVPDYGTETVAEFTVLLT